MFRIAAAAATLCIGFAQAEVGIGQAALGRQARVGQISLADLYGMTDLKAGQAENLTPSQLRLVFEGCREVNPDFFGLRDRIESAGRQILERLSSDLSETPAP